LKWGSDRGVPFLTSCRKKRWNGTKVFKKRNLRRRPTTASKGITIGLFFFRLENRGGVMRTEEGFGGRYRWGYSKSICEGNGGIKTPSYFSAEGWRELFQ